MGSHTATQSNDVVFRQHRPGDMGWIAHRHSYVYGKLPGYDSGFEALVLRIGADFLEKHNPEKERCWIAERDGQFLGCIMLIRDPDEEQAAKLRYLLVEEEARGLGIGGRLVTECLDFARKTGYKAVNLLTETSLFSARRLYAKAGFQIVKVEECEPWGAKMVQETWRLEL